MRVDILDVSLTNALGVLGSALKSPRAQLLIHSNKVAKQLRLAFMASNWNQVDALVQENFHDASSIMLASPVRRELEVVARISVDRRASEGLQEILRTPLDFELAVEYDAMRFVVGGAMRGGDADEEAGGRAPSPLNMGMGSPVMFVRHRRQSTAMSAGMLPNMRSGRSSAMSTASAMSVSLAPAHGGLDFNFDSVRRALNGVKALLANAEKQIPGMKGNASFVSPRTQSLLAATEMIVELRRWACNQEWESVASILQEALMMEDVPKEAAAELDAARRAHEEHRLLQRLVDAIQSGSASGVPGELRLHTVSWDELDAALGDEEDIAVSSGPDNGDVLIHRSRYLSVLLSTAKHLKSLRVAMLAAEWNTGVKEALTAIHVDCVNVAAFPL